MQRRLDKTDKCQGNGLRYNKHEEKITGESNIEKPSATKRGCNEMPSRKRDSYAQVRAVASLSPYADKIINDYEREKAKMGPSTLKSSLAKKGCNESTLKEGDCYIGQHVAVA